MNSLFAALVLSAAAAAEKTWIPLQIGPPSPRSLFIQGLEWAEPDCDFVDFCHVEGYYYVGLLENFIVPQPLEDEPSQTYRSKGEVWAVNCAIGWARPVAVFYHPHPMAQGGTLLVEDYARIGNDEETSTMLYPEVVTAVCRHIQAHGPN